MLPLLGALGRYHEAAWAPFHTPGHAYGRAADPAALSVLGSAAYAADLTELDETDSLHAPAGAIAQAQALAARAFGADETHFLVNGSTVGLQALIMAACPPGSGLALSRSSHMAVLGGVILAGARPVFLPDAWDAHWELPGAIAPSALEAAFSADPDLRAVLVTRPDYFGRAVALAPITELCRRYGRLLLVDEAHGAHLGLDPRLPTPALAQGADGVVQSTHKLLSAFTQAAMLHLKGPGLDRDRVRRMLRLLQSSSPSYLLMGSLDAARRQCETTGPTLWGRALDLVTAARERLGEAGWRCLGPAHGPTAEWDPAKLIVDLAATGHDGYRLAEALHGRGIQVEIATPRYLGAIVTPGNTPDDVTRLVAALLAAVPSGGRDPVPQPPEPGAMAVLPREALLGVARAILANEARGEVAAEFICPYPPGVPALVPGERITAEVLEYLRALKCLGADFVGPADPTLETIQVCASTPSSLRTAAFSS